MRRLLPAFLLLSSPLLLPAAPPVKQPGALGVIPSPQSVRVGPGRLTLSPTNRIVTTRADLAPLARILSDEIHLGWGLRLPTSDGPARAGDVVLAVSTDVRAGSPILAVRGKEVARATDGAHRIKVTDRVLVEGFDYRAVAEGTATLLQALRTQDGSLTVPKLDVHDWPHADFTGAMLDVGRQDNSPEHLRQCIQICRLYKVRYLHLHLTDDQGWTFPSSAYPVLGTRNGAAHGGVAPRRYSLAEMRALVRYADERGVTLVPEIEMPGHSGAARGALPQVFAHTDTKGKVHDVGMMDISNPKLYEALDTLLGEVADVFRSSPYIHIGGDEVSGLAELAKTSRAQAYMKANGLRDASELINHFTRRVNDMVKKRGKRTLIWEGAARESAPDLIVVCWDGNSRTAEQLIAKGFTTITCPWNLGVPWEKWNLYVCNGSFLKRKDAVLGALVPAWERGGEVAVQMVRNGVPRRQERTWNPDSTVTEAEFERRLTPVDQLLQRLLYGFAAVPAREAPVEAVQEVTCPVNAPLPLRLSSLVPGSAVRFTRDGSEPTPSSAAAEKDPIVIDDSMTLRARLFGADGKPLADSWRIKYLLRPLSVQASGALKDEHGKDSQWFAAKMTVELSSTLSDGTLRYTLDGSVPTVKSARYVGPVRLTKTTQLRARWFDGTKGRGEALAADFFQLTSVRHAARGKPVEIRSPRLEGQAAREAGRRLTDGYQARSDLWWAPEAVRCGDKDLDVVVDLGRVMPVHEAGARFLHSQESGVFPATLVTVSVSEDGKAFREVGSVPYSIPANPESRGHAGRLLTAKLEGVRGRFVRLHARNVAVIPAWHPVAKAASHMMVDEIVVNPEAPTGR